ncbi:MAG: hypothetical protein NMNS01_26830 [Nitrosomonas sp.]|nr:MAG: hypothetical protein NMNS01_26830 [Nitrosomonas sp.]
MMKYKKFKITNNEFILNKLNIKFKLLLLTIFVMTASCATHDHTGNFGVGNPKPLSIGKTKESLKEQLKTVKSKQDSIDPFTLHQEYLRSSNISQRGQLNMTPGDTVPTVNNVTQNDVTSDPPILVVTTPAANTIAGLMVDNYTSLESFAAHKINSAENYDIDVMDKGKGGEIFKIKFDLWVDPARQDYLSYVWRWIPAIFTKRGFQNYTKDYHMETHFSIIDDPTAEIVLVRPTHEGINSYETTFLQKTSQLAGGGTWQGIAAEIDLAERHREQFKEQRKNPILRGIVDNEAEFRFIVSPRQYVAQRTFRIPFFMSRYSIERRLESGPYPVSAYILIKDKNVNNLRLKICGNYKQFGYAHRSGDPIKFGKSELNDPKNSNCGFFNLQLDRTDIRPKVSQEGNTLNLSWGDREIKADASCENTTENSANVKLVNIKPDVNKAILKQGKFNSNKIFWIEADNATKNDKNKEFELELEFCSKNTTAKAKLESYRVKQGEYRSEVSINKVPIHKSTSGSEVKISILGTPGEKLEIESINFGNENVEVSQKKLNPDINPDIHILEFKVIVPYFEKSETITNIITMVANVKINGGTELIPITVAQSLTIN